MFSLQYVRDYLSIKQFNPVELSDLTILTGLNGSGKSHLLEAIEQKCVHINGDPNLSIVKFNYENFRLENEAEFNAYQLGTEKGNAWNFYNGNIKHLLVNAKGHLGPSHSEIADECKRDKVPLLSRNDRPEVTNYRNTVDQYFAQQHIRTNNDAAGVYSLVRSLPFPLDEITEEDFRTLYKPVALKNNFLPHQLGKVIWDYYIKYRQNQVNEFENQRYGKDYPVLSETDFLARHGEKPWELINKILRKFSSIQYQITSPEGTDVFKNYALRLVHTSDPNLQIDFSSLSSGEKVLMALVASIYKSSFDRYFPDVLLLDEIDATLHPSMMRNMIEVIQEEFISRGTKVILVTHSPTTVALAPEDCVFVMNRAGLSRVEKSSNGNALSILTEGFAILQDGVRLFDQVGRLKATVITEGKNTKILRKAFELFGVSDIEILDGIEANSGKTQLKTLYDFFVRVPHEKTVIFVWDCDVNYSLDVVNNTVPIIIPRNAANTVAKSGIENAFSESLFHAFQKRITLSTGETKIEFDESRKRDFEDYLLRRNSIADFEFLRSTIEAIRSAGK
ncbi:ATP-binding protein [Aquitalea sp. USM4]|uniref:AAA family ATPase n=1 Tax=Aquitalea sp. USM4 TaxID=1590041 RepID=UPI00103B8491|nr:ATP-binding protein [Aquitalea sp. USM4]QBJ78205.1 hypothetical protein DKK66_08965 [Aquitalea sp. USM4]